VFEDLNSIRRLVSDSTRVAVLGTGQTGLSLSLVFGQCDYRVFALDEYLTEDTCKATLKEHGVKLIEKCLGEGDKLDELSVDFFFTSPGISQDRPLVKHFINKGVPQVSELDLFNAFVGPPAVSVTGTNGKTTVASLIQKMFAAEGIKSRLLGNSGRAISSALIGELMCEPGLRGSNDIFEVSSYQLEQSQFFSARTNIFLNFSPDHLERHGSADEYFCSKAKLFRDRGGMEHGIFGQCSDELRTLSEEVPNRFSFGLIEKTKAGESGCFYDATNATLVLRGLDSTSEEVLSLSGSSLFGIHNYLNLAAASLAARLNKISLNSIQKILDEFVSLPHRIELLGEVEEVKFFNDSKSTNPASTIAAVEAVTSASDGETLLILGGKPKAGSMEELANTIASKISTIYTFGPYAETISDLLVSQVAELSSVCKQMSSLDEVFTNIELENLKAGAVLFSPACASFDSYRNYEERGEHFKQLFKSKFL